MRLRALIAMFMGPTWGPSRAERAQVGRMLAPWTLLSRRSRSWNLLVKSISNSLSFVTFPGRGQSSDLSSGQPQPVQYRLHGYHIIIYHGSGACSFLSKLYIVQLLSKPKPNALYAVAIILLSTPHIPFGSILLTHAGLMTVPACECSASSHNLNQWLVIIHWTTGTNDLEIFNWKTKTFLFQENAFENMVCKMSIIFRPRCVEVLGCHCLECW